MAGEKEYKIRIATQGDPSGAKEVEKAIDDTTDSAKRLEEATDSIDSFTSGGTTTLSADLRKAEKSAEKFTEAVEDAAAATKDFSKAPPLPFQPSEVQPVAKSIAELTSEVQRLERELEQVPVGGEAFVALGSKVGAARRDLADAHQETRKLAGSMGRSGDGGMAVLEFSRAFEDAQYGIRGLLNNIPGLIAMLGGGAGLAGVISLAAVAGTQLWEALSEDKGAEEKLEDIDEILKGLGEKFLELGRRRKEAAQVRLADQFDAEARSLDFATSKMLANIDALKERERLAGEMDAIRTQNSIGEIERRRATGEVSGQDADRAIAELRKGLAEREIQRLKQLGELDLRAFQEKEKAAQEQVGIRDKEAALIASQIAELEARKAAFDAAAKEYLKLQQAGGREAGSALEPFIDIDRRRDALDRVEKVLGVEGAPDDPEISPEARKRAAERAKELTDELNILQSEFTEAASAVKEAREELRSAGDEKEIANQQVGGRVAGEVQSATATDAAENVEQARQAITNAEARAAEEVGKMLDGILSSLGSAAQAPDVQQKATAVRTLLEGGLQRAEAGDAQLLLQRLVSLIDSDVKLRISINQKVETTLGAAETTLRAFANRLSDLESAFNNISQQQGNPNF